MARGAALALEEEAAPSTRAAERFGEGSDQHARVRLGLATAAQASGRDGQALEHFRALESARRALAPWDGAPGDGAPMLLAHRLKMGRRARDRPGARPRAAARPPRNAGTSSLAGRRPRP